MSLLAMPVVTFSASAIPGTTVKDCDDCPVLVEIPSGSFLMGTKVEVMPTFPDLPSDEYPQHSVSIKAILMGKFEVTQKEWQAVMGVWSGHAKGGRYPVEGISWSDAQDFVLKLSAKTGKTYRLPTEAEWEYAARAGSQAAYSFGNSESDLGRYAWFSKNAGNASQPIGEKLGNAWGIHDMHGNIREWTQDCWESNYRKSAGDGRPMLAGACLTRVLRGGSWGDNAEYLRSAYRHTSVDFTRNEENGLRVVRELD